VWFDVLLEYSQKFKKPIALNTSNNKNMLITSTLEIAVIEEKLSLKIIVSNKMPTINAEEKMYS
jgi:hypothetical protein